MTDAVILSRFAEHAAATFVGALVIFLGYRLFRDMPARREGETKIALPGGISIFLSRVGPGVFFALFGAALIGYTTTRPVSYQESDALGSSRAYSGLMNGPAQLAPRPAPGVPANALPVGRAVRVLADIAKDVNATPMSPQRLQRELALRDGRALLMLQNWQDGWGSADSFRAWVFDRGAEGDPPADAAGGVVVFNGAAP